MACQEADGDEPLFFCSVGFPVVTTQVNLTKAAGVLIGCAAGDALGAGYEFAATVPERPAMIGGGLGDFAPGEWTDDTAMTVLVADGLVGGAELPLEDIAEGFLGWYAADPADIGIQTRAVLSAATDLDSMQRAARGYYAAHPDRAAGNGSLMRTSPVALAFAGDDHAIAEAASAISELTHADPTAGDACVLWSIAVDRALREDRLDGARDGLALIPAERRTRWAQVLDNAAAGGPPAPRDNGWCVTALQAALAAVLRTDTGDDDHLERGLIAAVRIGGDTDTVAAIAGALLGARYGVDAVPEEWRRILHGWPGLDAQLLGSLARDVVGWRALEARR